MQKTLAAAGIASRRKCEDLIAQGRVKVNDKKIKLGDKADIDYDVITLDDRVIKPEKKVYYALNKPRGYVTSMKEKGKQVVKELIKIEEKVFPVGRLDENAEGLLILTNDGELANRIMHPRYQTSKTYEVVLDKKFKDYNKLMSIILDGKKVKVKYYRKLPRGVEITIHEGKKHVVKRIFIKLGYKVTELKRTRIANIELGNLSKGKHRPLTKKELSELRQILKIR